RHGLLLNRWMTVKASASNNQAFTGADVKAYTINETAQWVSLWRHLSLGTRIYWGLGGALDREILHDLAAGTSASRDERVVGIVAGVDMRCPCSTCASFRCAATGAARRCSRGTMRAW